MLKLDDDFKVSFLFENSDDQGSDEIELLKDAPVVAECPICDSEIKQTGLSYLCVQNKKISDGECSFRITRKLLDKEIPLKNSKLVGEKENWSHQGFVSRRTKRSLMQTNFEREWRNWF